MRYFLKQLITISAELLVQYRILIYRGWVSNPITGLSTVPCCVLLRGKLLKEARNTPGNWILGEEIANNNKCRKCVCVSAISTQCHDFRDFH